MATVTADAVSMQCQWRLLVDPNPVLLIGVDGVVQHVHFVAQLNRHPSPCKTPAELTLCLPALLPVPILQNTSTELTLYLPVLPTVPAL